MNVAHPQAPDQHFIGVERDKLHFAGQFEGKSLVDKYPDGLAPYAVGEPANIVTNYGYDIITQIQATKDGLCNVKPA